MSCAGLARAQSDDWIKPALRERPEGPQRRESDDNGEPRRGRLIRDVLAVFDGDQEPAPDRTRIHRYLEMPLNHLGLAVTYWDLRGGIPDAETLKRHRAVVTWFGERIANPDAWLDWAARQAALGTRFVVLESVGVKADGDNLAKVNGFLKSLGLEMQPRWVGSAEAGTIVERDAGMIDFESSLGPGLPGYTVVQTRGPAVKSHLTLLSRDMRVAPQVRSSVLATGPGGGFAAIGYVRRYDARTGRLSWLINPFAFLTAALGLERRPIPDTTTIAGRRIYFATAEVGEAARDADLLARELIEPYPDLPVSLAVASAGRDEGAIDALRRIYALPQVEAAALTATGVQRWSFFEAYDRQRELARRAIVYASPALATKLGAAGLLPRLQMSAPFSLEAEIAGPLAATAALSPAAKPAPLYLWSGDQRPFEAAVRAARSAGARNLGGGDARFDGEYPSLMYFPPLSRPVGAERQIYALSSSDAAYTRGWRGPLGGQAELARTWTNTEAPRRLAGMELRFSDNAVRHPQSAEAVRGLLAHVRSAAIHPISASAYAALADSFFKVEIARIGPQRWRVSNRGTLHTVRFDDAAGMFVDPRQSVGVLGSTHAGSTLYVALDAAVPDAVVALTPNRLEPRRLDRPQLLDSRWDVSSLKAAECGFEAEVKGYGPGEMTWAGLRPGGFVLSLRPARSDVEVLKEAAVGQDGELKLALDGDATSGAHLKVSCARAGQLLTGSVRRRP